jgi:hypothetical protein
MINAAKSTKGRYSRSFLNTESVRCSLVRRKRTRDAIKASVKIQDRRNAARALPPSKEKQVRENNSENPVQSKYRIVMEPPVIAEQEYSKKHGPELYFFPYGI